MQADTFLARPETRRIRAACPVETLRALVGLDLGGTTADRVWREWCAAQGHPAVHLGDKLDGAPALWLQREYLLRLLATMAEQAAWAGPSTRDFVEAARLRGALAQRIAKDAGEDAALAAVSAILLDVACLAFATPALPGDRGAAAMAREEDRHGVDHTRAGKWLGEAWGLPQRVVEAIWLHHHALDTVKLIAGAPRLIAVCTLSDLLGAGGPMEAITRYREELGISADRLASMLDEARAEVDGEGPKTVSPPAPDAPEDQLNFRFAYAEALLQAASPVDVMQALAEALRHASRAERGICHATYEDGAGAHCASWAAPDAPVCLRQIDLDTESNGGGQAAALVALLSTLHPLGTAAPDAQARRGLLALPISHAGEILGQVVIENPHGIAVGSDMEHLAAMAARVLHRLAERCRDKRQAEAMAEALWKREAGLAEQLRRERLAGIARMAAGAAHEINNPLAVISGRAQLLLSRVADTGHAQALETIVQQSRRVSKVLNGLIQFARPITPRLAPAVVQLAVRQVVGTLRDRFERKGIKVDELYTSDLPRARLDRHLFEQAMLHILVNAEQAMPSGGRLTVSVRPGHGGETVLIAIHDTGEGISADHLPQVFDPFFTTRRQGEGHTGLGLSIVHGIVTSHRGEVAITSTPGEGTTVTLVLPAQHTGRLPHSETSGEYDAADEQDEAVELEESQQKAAVLVGTIEEQPSIAAEADTIHAELGEESGEIALPESTTETDNSETFLSLPESAAQTGLPEIQALPEQAEIAFAPSALREPPPTRRAALTPELPAFQPRSIGPVRANSGAAPNNSVHGTVLVVEEDEDLREILRAALEGRGLQVRTAPDGLEGLADALAHPPDLLISATRLSGVDGLTILRQVRQRYANLPILLLSGPGQDDDAAEAPRLGARAVLPKPLDMERLFAEVGQVLSSRNVA